MSEVFNAGAGFDLFARRAKQGVLTKATLAYYAATILVAALFFLAAGSAILTIAQAYGPLMQATMQGREPGMEEVAPLLQAYLALSPLILILLFVSFLLFAAFEAAVLRWLIRGEEGGGLFGLRFNADMWRVWFSYWVWFVLLIGFYIACFVVAIAAGVASVAVVGRDNANPGIAVALVTLFVGLFLGATLYILIRLAPATAASVGLNRFAFFNAWTATRHRFWSLLGAFILPSLIYLVVIMLFQGVLFGIILAPLIGTMATGGPPDPTALLTSLLTPTNIAILLALFLLVVVAQAILRLCYMAVNAKLVRVALANGELGAPAP